MKIVEKKVSELVPYENNPRHNEHSVEFVKNSIKEFGFKNPIIIDKDNVIVAGHTRHLAAKDLGLETVPCIIADDLTEKQLKAFRIADNKTAELATWDNELLCKEVEDLMADYDFTDFGFGDFELTILTDDLTPESYDEELIDRYADIGEKCLANNRVIITYKTGGEEEEFVKNLVKFTGDGELPVTFRAGDLMDKYEE